MAEVLVGGEIDAPVDALWRCISTFGEVPWMKGVTRVELEGEGVGMARLVYAGGDVAVREVLESVDHQARRLDYTITQNNPLPVSDYHARCVAVDLGGGRSRLDWGCSYVPKGDEAAVRLAVEGMYRVLISWVKEAVEAGR